MEDEKRSCFVGVQRFGDIADILRRTYPGALSEVHAPQKIVVEYHAVDKHTSVLHDAHCGVARGSVF